MRAGAASGDSTLNRGAGHPAHLRDRDQNVARLHRRLRHPAVHPARFVETQQPFGEVNQRLDAQPCKKPEDKIDRRPTFEDYVPLQLTPNNIARDGLGRPTESGAVRFDVFKCKFIEPIFGQASVSARIDSRMNTRAGRKIIEALGGKLSASASLVHGKETASTGGNVRVFGKR